MKRIVLLILTIILTVGIFTVSNAANSITERPDIKIIIDGVTGKYTDTPIIVNGRTLLPLRELLTNLGVVNDDQHIIWNSKDSSVTARKDSTKLYLKVGTTSAKVNDKVTTIDAAPVNYKGRVYIPARFAAEAFNKVVVWDSLARRIYMRNSADFNEVKTTLEKSVALMDGLKRFKEYGEVNYFETDINGLISNYSCIACAQVDLEKKVAYCVSDYQNFKVELYEIDELEYTKISNETEWEKENYKYFDEPYLDLNDTIFAAMTIDKSQNDNTIRLFGDVSLSYVKDIDPTYTVDFECAYSELIIDKTTGYIIRYHFVDQVLVTPTDGDIYVIKEDYDCRVFDFNSNFTINVPAELQ